MLQKHSKSFLLCASFLGVSLSFCWLEEILENNKVHGQTGTKIPYTLWLSVSIYYILKHCFLKNKTWCQCVETKIWMMLLWMKSEHCGISLILVKSGMHTHLISPKFCLVEYQRQWIGHSICFTQRQMCILVHVYLVFNHSKMLQWNLEIIRAPGELSWKNINDNKTLSIILIMLLYRYEYLPAGVVNILPTFTPQTQNQPTFGRWWMLIPDYAHIWRRIACAAWDKEGEFY